MHPFCNLQSRARTLAVLGIGLYELLGNPTTYLTEPPGALFIRNDHSQKIEKSNTVSPVYKGHSRESENVAFISSCPLYTGKNLYALFNNGEKLGCPV